MGRNKWTKELLVTAFLEYASSGGDVRATPFRKSRADLYGSILYHFKSYPNFISEVGLDYKLIHGRRFWTDEEVTIEFKRYEEENDGDISPKAMQSRRPDLYGQIDYRFGYKAFLESIGYDYQDALRRKSWTECDVIDELKARFESRESLMSVEVIGSRLALYRACFKLFGSYRNALESAGINYTENVGSFNVASTFGFEFEGLLAEMFDALDFRYEHHSRHVGGIIPDFYDKQNSVIIDAKLSSWTVFYSDTIEKYAPHCEKLIIVYLRGKEIKCELSNVELRHVSFYYEELRNLGLSDFISRFDALERKADCIGKADVA